MSRIDLIFFCGSARDDKESQRRQSKIGMEIGELKLEEQEQLQSGCILGEEAQYHRMFSNLLVGNHLYGFKIDW